MTTEPRDPRSIITPEAFEIDPALLGMPLATPVRRLWAVLIDLAVVGLLTALLSDVQLLLWGAIALVLVRLAFKRSTRAMSQAAGVLLRASAGCLGVVILSIVLVVWGISRMGGEDREAVINEVIEGGTRFASPELRREIADYASADTPEAALRVMREGARRMRDLPVAARRQLLRASVPADAAWAAQADSLVELALASPEGGPSAADTADGAGRAVADLSDADVLGALAAEAVSPTADRERLLALRARATALVAADTLEALADEVVDLRSELDDERAARQELERELGESRTGMVAFAGLLGDVWQQAGSAIGLWSLYFTALLTLWRGQTIGKRIMRVRVLRLDGQPIGWWSAFERAGGYVAGLATGLLGFAQVLWDPNRQCIHDKIVGTVVIADGAERVPGAWEEAWGRRTKSW